MSFTARQTPTEGNRGTASEMYGAFVATTYPRCDVVVFVKAKPVAQVLMAVVVRGVHGDAPLQEGLVGPPGKQLVVVGVRVEGVVGMV